MRKKINLDKIVLGTLSEDQLKSIVGAESGSSKSYVTEYKNGPKKCVDISVTLPETNIMNGCNTPKPVSPTSKPYTCLTAAP